MDTDSPSLIIRMMRMSALSRQWRERSISGIWPISSAGWNKYKEATLKRQVMNLWNMRPLEGT